jgi:hypothetical protein
LFGKLIREVRREDLSSDLYDLSLLSKLWKRRGLLEGELRSLDFPLGQMKGAELVEFDSKVVTSAQILSDKTPTPRQVRVIGKLDMVWHSTRSFELILAAGSAVRGVLVDGMTDELQKHFGNDVTILGRLSLVHREVCYAWTPLRSWTPRQAGMRFRRFRFLSQRIGQLRQHP